MRIGITVYEAEQNEALLVNIIDGIQPKINKGELLSMEIKASKGIVLELVDTTPDDPNAVILDDSIELTDGGI